MEKQPNCRKAIWALSIAAGLFVSAFIFSPFASAQEDGTVAAALEDLSAAIGQPVSSKDQAVAICDSEKYFEICADVGKKHSLYAPEEIKQVDTFIAEIRGAVAEQLKNCQTTECLIGVANELAKKVTAKDSKLAENFELTAKFVEKKQAVITAAKEAGVDYDSCRNMDPDTADINTLRACAKLAKDNRVKDIIPEAARAQVKQYGDYVDKSVELRSSLQTGEFQCGDGTLNGCGNFCLNPSGAARAQGDSAIPPVCRQIAQKFFGTEGVKQLEAAYSQVSQVQDYYKKKSDNLIFTTIDGRTLTRPEEIGRYMEEQGRSGNVEAVEKGMDFMISKGFVKPEEKEFVLKFVKQAKDKGGNVDFDKCVKNPEACRDFIPEDQRGKFEAHSKIEQIMRREIGFNPQDCARGGDDPSIGQRCFEGSKRALPQLEELAAKSPEVKALVAEIKGHIARGEEFQNKKEQFNQVFQQQGGPGGCKSEQECRNYCSDSAHGPECIAFGAQQGISGFKGEEAVKKLQEYSSNLQRPQYGSQPYPGQGDFGFPGQGQGVPGGFPGQGYGVPGGFPGQGYGVPGGFPGQGYPVQGSFPGGQGGYPIPGGFPGGGPVGPSPECFAAIQSGDFAKAKVVCESRIATPPPIGSICPALYSVNSCPVGEIKVVSYSSPECGVYYSCQKEYQGQPSYTPYYPVPTGGDYRYCPPPGYWDESIRGCRSGGPYSPYPTPSGNYPIPPSCPAGQYWEYLANACKPNDYRPESSYTPPPSCPAGQWWDYYYKTCTSTTTYSPYPTYTPVSACSSSLTNLLGTGCHWMYSDSSGRGVYCDSGMTKSAKEGDTAVTAGCTGGSATYSPYPTYTPVSACSSSLTNLLGTGCHWMYSDSSGRGVYCDSGMTKSAKEGDTAVTAGCTGGSATYSPYPSGTPTPTSSGSCPSGSHTMYVNNAGGYCMSDSDSLKCGPLNSTSTSGFGSCSAYGGSTTYSPSLSTSGTYTPYPTGTTSASSCPSGSHSMGSYCMSDADSTKCGPSGSSSTSGWGSCSTYQTTTTYTPYPSAGSCPAGQYWYYPPAGGAGYCQTSTTTSYTPYPTCTVAGEWWDPATSSCKSTTTTTTTYTPTPTPATTSTPAPTPAPTTDPSAGCASAGGTWNGSSCVYPTATPAPTYSAPPSCPSGQFWDTASSTCKTAFNSQLHQMAVARTIMACASSSGDWNAAKNSCQSPGFVRSFFGNISKIFSRFLK